MSLSSLLGMSVVLSRYTPYLIDPRTVAASMTIIRQPVRESHVVVEVAGVTQGTLSVQGNVAGVGVVQETFAFTQPDVRQTSNRFTSLTAVTTSGMSVGTVGVKAVDRDGQPILGVETARTVAVHLARRGRLQPGPLSLAGPGAERVMDVQMYMESDEDILPGDLVSYAGQTYSVANLIPLTDTFSPMLNHKVAEMVRVER